MFDEGLHELTCGACGAPLHEMKMMPLARQEDGAGRKAGKHREKVQIDWDAERRHALGDRAPGRFEKPSTRPGSSPLTDASAAIAWAIGRIGARVPLYGPLNTVVPADEAADWLARALIAATCSRASSGSVTNDHTNSAPSSGASVSRYLTPWPCT